MKYFISSIKLIVNKHIMFHLHIYYHYLHNSISDIIYSTRIKHKYSIYNNNIKLRHYNVKYSAVLLIVLRKNFRET